MQHCEKKFNVQRGSSVDWGTDFSVIVIQKTLFQHFFFGVGSSSNCKNIRLPYRIDR